MKEVLSSHDISAVVLELQTYIGTRINNVYDDTNTSKYCLKLDYILYLQKLLQVPI